MARETSGNRVGCRMGYTGHAGRGTGHAGHEMHEMGRAAHHAGHGESATCSPVAARGAIGAVHDEDVRYDPWTRGIAWVDDALVFVTYGPREFRALWGGGADEYNDFLVRRQQVIAYHQESWSPAQMVPIPFDTDDFRQWLSENSIGRACGDPHREWALSVFMDSGKLEFLRTGHPLSHCVPDYERLDARVHVWTIAVTVRDRGAMTRMGRRLPSELVSHYGRELVARSICRIPRFER